MRALVIAALMVAGPSHAAGAFERDGVRIDFADSPCTLPVISEALAKAIGGTPRHARVDIRGRVLVACYVVDEDGDYLLVDELGAGGYVEGKTVKETGA